MDKTDAINFAEQLRKLWDEANIKIDDNTGELFAKGFGIELKYSSDEYLDIGNSRKVPGSAVISKQKGKPIEILIGNNEKYHGLWKNGNTNLRLIYTIFFCFFKIGIKAVINPQDENFNDDNTFWIDGFFHDMGVENYCLLATMIFILTKEDYKKIMYECSNNNLINLEEFAKRTSCDIKTIKQLGMYYNFIERPF